MEAAAKARLSSSCDDCKPTEPLCIHYSGGETCEKDVYASFQKERCESSSLKCFAHVKYDDYGSTISVQIHKPHLTYIEQLDLRGYDQVKNLLLSAPKPANVNVVRSLFGIHPEFFALAKNTSKVSFFSLDVGHALRPSMLPHMRELVIANTPLRDFPPSLLAFKSLVDLRLVSNDIREVDVPRSPARFASKIRSLQLSGNPIEKFNLDVPNVEFLIFTMHSNSSIQEIPVRIFSYQRLRRLDLRFNTLHPSFPAALTRPQVNFLRSIEGPFIEIEPAVPENCSGKVERVFYTHLVEVCVLDSPKENTKTNEINPVNLDQSAGNYRIMAIAMVGSIFIIVGITIRHLYIYSRSNKRRAS